MTTELEVALEAATAAGRLLRERMHSIREVRHKGVVDLVTDVDIASERLIAGQLRAAFPSHTIVGEEHGASEGGDPRFRWFVDPVDGTTNYAHGFPYFSVSIGFQVDGQPALGVVCAPVFDELFVAEAGRGASLNGQPIAVSTTTDL